MNINLKIKDQLKINLQNKLSNLDISLEDYLLRLIQNDINSNVNLIDGYTYNSQLSLLLNKNNIPIELTNTQKRIIETLITNYPEITSNEDLIKSVWYKPASVFTLRNMIKKIRDASCEDIVITHKSDGYSINLFKN